LLITTFPEYRKALLQDYPKFEFFLSLGEIRQFLEILLKILARAKLINYLLLHLNFTNAASF